MITFGIQGVMLTVAWLIGETFATTGRSTTEAAGSQDASRFQRGFVGACLVVSVVSIGILVLGQSGYAPYGYTTGFIATVLGFLEDNALKIALLGLVACFAVVSLNARTLEAAIRSLRLIGKHAGLWLMFVACMGVSVFFSFDSLFSTIFPDDERRRAADIRTRSSVARIVQDIERASRIDQQAAQRALLSTPEWTAYAGALAGLNQRFETALDTLTSNAAQSAEALNRQLSLQEDATRTKTQAQKLLTAQRLELERRSKKERANVDQLKSVIEELDRNLLRIDNQIIQKTAEAESEARGIGVTARRGRGPTYRRLMSEVQKLKAGHAVEQLKRHAHAPRLDAAEQAYSTTQGQLTDLARRGADAKRAGEDARSIDALRDAIAKATEFKDQVRTASSALAHRMTQFVGAPTRDRLNDLETQCRTGLGTLSRVPGLDRDAAALSCGSERVHQVASPLYALNDGRARLAGQCDGGKRLPVTAQMETQLAFARRCLQDANLIGTGAGRIHSAINALERNRDDKSHRFIVSLNAFGDGSKLAYLALAIAVIIDALVFICGVLGAKSASSPLDAIPNTFKRTTRDLESLVENALAPDVARNAALALANIRPLSSSDMENDDHGWPHALDLKSTGLQATPVLWRLVNAGTMLNAVRERAGQSDGYLLRGELVEFLVRLAQWGQQSRGASQCLDLKTTMLNAMRDHPSETASMILKHLTPTSRKFDFSSVLDLNAVSADDRQKILLCLNGAAALGRVRAHESQGRQHQYLIHKELFHVLTEINQAVPPRSHPTDEVQSVETAAHARAVDALKPLRRHAPVSPRQVLKTEAVEKRSKRVAEQAQFSARKAPPVETESPVAPLDEGPSRRGAEDLQVSVTGDSIRFD